PAPPRVRPGGCGGGWARGERPSARAGRDPPRPGAPAPRRDPAADPAGSAGHEGDLALEREGRRRGEAADRLGVEIHPRSTRATAYGESSSSPPPSADRLSFAARNAPGSSPARPALSSSRKRRRTLGARGF